MKYLACAIVLLAGCTSHAPNYDDIDPACYPVIHWVDGLNDVVDDENNASYVGASNTVNLTHGGPIELMAQRACGPVRWYVEDPAGRWVEGDRLTIPARVGTYVVSLVIDLGEPTVMHSTTFLVEDRREREPLHAPAGTSDLVVRVDVQCCLLEAGAAVTVLGMQPVQSPVPSAWVQIVDPAGTVVASGFERAGLHRDEGLESLQGNWTLSLNRSDPSSPYWNREVLFATDMVVPFGQVREPGSTLD